VTVEEQRALVERGRKLAKSVIRWNLKEGLFSTRLTPEEEHRLALALEVCLDQQNQLRELLVRVASCKETAVIETKLLDDICVAIGESRTPPPPPPPKPARPTRLERGRDE
jgi:hypothetical protein